MSIRLDALPQLDYLWELLTHLAAAEGIAIAIADFGGYRTDADTTRILGFKQADYDAYTARERRAGRVPLPITGPWDGGNSRPIAPYGDSMHNYGAARDFTIVKRPASMPMASAVRRVQDIGEDIGLRSGRSFGDDRHLELPFSLDEAAEQWAAWNSSDASTGAETAGLAPALVIVGITIAGIAAARYASGLKSWR